jgi:hypothetical protein
VGRKWKSVGPAAKELKEHLARQKAERREKTMAEIAAYNRKLKAQKKP